MRLADLLENLKDMKSTLPGTLALIGSAVVLCKEMVVEIMEFVKGLGYTLTPDTEKLVAAIVGIIAIKMILFDKSK